MIAKRPNIKTKLKPGGVISDPRQVFVLLQINRDQFHIIYLSSTTFFLYPLLAKGSSSTASFNSNATAFAS